MPRIVLGWQLNRRVEDDEVHRLIARIENRYQGLFAEPLEHRGLWQDNQGLLSFEIQPDADPHLHLTADRIVCLRGNPTAAHGVRVSARSLAEGLQGGSIPIHRVNPPFTLCSFDKREKTLRVFHDGLGMDSFFIAETAGGIVFSNKCWCILQLLGETPRADEAAWRYWFCLGWFPDNSTPFKNIRYLDRGEIITADSRSVRLRKEDALGIWVAGGAPYRPELMERAEDSFRRLILGYPAADGRYHADLTGGIDSRAVCSVLLKERAACVVSTDGALDSADVVIARDIAKKFGLAWKPRQAQAIPNRREFGRVVDAQFRQMTLWSEGLVEPNRFTSFDESPSTRRVDPFLGGGSAEISKGHFYSNALLSKPDRSYGDSERRLLEYFGANADSILADADAAELKAKLRDQISAGKDFGLESFGLLDLFYVSQRTRRWQSAHLAAYLFDVAILPFVNLEHIRLGLAMSPAGKVDGSFQKFIIRRNAQRLLSIPLNQKRRTVSNSLRDFIGRGLPQDLGWSRHFQGNGAEYAERVASVRTPLENILDLSKRNGEQGWQSMGAEDWYFYLRLISFCYWHSTYIDPGKEIGSAIWS